MPLVITVGTAESFVCALLPQSIVAQRNVPPPSAIIPPSLPLLILSIRLDSFVSLAVRPVGSSVSGFQTHCILCRPPSSLVNYIAIYLRMYIYMCDLHKKEFFSKSEHYASYLMKWILGRGLGWGRNNRIKTISCATLMTYNYSYIYKNFSNFPRNEIKFSIIRVTSPSNIFTGGEISRYIWNSTQFVSKYASWCASFFLGAAKSRQHPPFNRWIFAKTSYAADLEFFFFQLSAHPFVCPPS